MPRLAALVVAAVLVVASGPGWAQAARAATAGAELPEPAPSELVGTLPPGPVIVLTMDHQGLAEGIAASVPTRGHDALVADVVRALAWVLWADEGAEDTGLDLPLASASAVGLYPPDGEAVIVTSRRALRGRMSDGDPPERIGQGYVPLQGARRGNRVIVADENRIEAALDDATVGWSIQTAWPEIADAWADDALLRVYFDANELVQTSPHPGGAVRLFRDRGIRRFAFVVHADAGAALYVDAANGAVILDGLGALAARARAALADDTTHPAAGALLGLVLEGILSRISADATASPPRITVAAPACGGLLQQMTAGVFVIALLDRTLHHPLPDPAPWAPVVDAAALPTCPDPESIEPSLDLSAILAVDEDADEAAGIALDLGAVIQQVTANGGGLLPFALDRARVDAVLAAHDVDRSAPLPLSLLVLGRSAAGSGGVWWHVPTALDPLLSPLHLRVSTVDGDTRVFGRSERPTRPADAADPAWRGHVPTGSLGAVVLGPGVFTRLANELPTALRGPWVQMFAESRGVVLALDADGRPTATLVSDDLTADDADRLPSLFTMAVQGALQLGAMELRLGPRGVQAMTDLGGRLGALGSGEAFDGGVRFTVDVDGRWLLLAAMGASTVGLPRLHTSYYDAVRWPVESGMRTIIEGARAHWETPPDGGTTRSFPPSIGPTPPLAELTERCATVPTRGGMAMAAHAPEERAVDADADTWERVGFDPEEVPWASWSLTSSGTDMTAEFEVTAWVDVDCDGDYATYTWQSDPGWHGGYRPWPGSHEAPIEVANPWE